MSTQTLDDHAAPRDLVMSLSPESAEALRSMTTSDDRLGYLVTKRVLDIVISGLLLVLLAPLLLIVAVSVRLDSRGPAFFCQERLGVGCKPFRMLKFRSMRVNDNSDTTHRTYVHALIEGTAERSSGANGTAVYKLVHDDRITGTGRILRRTSIDELPQLVNVFLGSMTLVGPRPPLAYEVERYTGRHMRRMAVKPGITGLWQVSGRNALGFEEMIGLDLEYIDRRSFGLDLAILARTLPAVLRLSGA